MDRTLYRAEDFAADESFISYYLGTDPEAVQSWEEWISHHPEKVDEIINAEALLAVMHIHLPTRELDEETARFEHFLLQQQTPERPVQNRQYTKKLTWLSIAALVAVIAGLTLIYYPAEKPLHYITRHNGNGQVLHLQLNDGSRITLNANSSLRMPEVFGAGKREVFLEGEAFFEVAKDKTRPFTVVVNGTRTTVLGTKFNIAAYRDLPEVQVALQEGSVEFAANANRDKMILKPGEMGVFSSKNKSLVRRNFDQAAVTSWQTGLIIFNKANFSEVASKLAHVYGIKLLDHSGKHNWAYSARFDKTDYLSIISSICFSEKLTYKQTNQTIILNPKK